MKQATLLVLILSSWLSLIGANNRQRIYFWTCTSLCTRYRSCRSFQIIGAFKTGPIDFWQENFKCSPPPVECDCKSVLW